jgi:energy-coupling factor transporter ATP-binding protein EcfA2
VGWSADGSKLVSGSDDSTVRLWDAQSGEALATLWADGTQHTALLPSGFYRSSADAEGELSLALHPARSPQSKFYLPLTGGLLTVFNRPDYVEAALTGRPPAAEQRNAELLAAGFAGGTAWDGQPHRVPAKTRTLPIEEPRDKNLSLHNPFRPGPAQDDVHHLPGRDEVLAEIHSLIESRSPAILIGPRRSGKTSILRLLNRQLSPQRRVRLLTLEGKQIGSGDDLARLLSSQLGLGAKPKRSDKTERQHLADQLQAMRPQPLFLFDEVIHLQDGDATLFPWLRALGQDLASIVYAGSPLDWVRVVQRAAKVAPGSSFGNDVTPVKLGPISESDALYFLVHTSQGQIPESAARWVIEVCGPWPFYLQVMGHALFECVRSGQRKPLLDRGAFLDLYEQRLLSDRAAPFTGRWEELPAPVRTLLLQPESLLSRPVYLEQPQSVRRHLVDAGLCSPQGSWLADRPFFDWIRANASLLSSEP